MYSKESPCCGRYIINIKRGKNKALYMLVNPREPQSKNKNKKSLSVLTSEKKLVYCAEIYLPAAWPLQ
jgi:hypothetical protein